MKKYLMLAGSLAFATFALQSCLDYDDPGDELGFGSIQIQGELTRVVGKVDSIVYNKPVTPENTTKAIEELNTFFRQALGGRYSIRGGKEAQYPGDHAYQRQYCLGPDAYAQYMVVPHKDFMYGTLTSTYNVSPDFNGGPLGAYTMAKNGIIPLLNQPAIDSIPEMKAANLLYYCLTAQEQADLSGPYTYFEDKKNEEDPREYDNLKSIYYGIVENLDTIVNCLKAFDNRPDWYKEQISALLIDPSYFDINPAALFEGDNTFKSYIKLANSLKLRMAMHIVKVEPETAKKWAEEAVASGVIEAANEQQGFFTLVTGGSHPLVNICNSWGDLRMCASFESLLMSLDHPYTKTLFKKNEFEIVNAVTGEVTPANSKICGIRAGVLVGDGQTYALNMRQAYSTIDSEVFSMGMPPLFFIKWAEVDFLRAEGALRGWNMGGTAQFFYERGIRNASFEDPMAVSWGMCNYYAPYVDDYMAQEEPVAYVNSDPMGDGEDWESVTKIGVKWNEGDDNETKLEKIITQKYIALFPLSTEAWTEMRRTGYPKVFPVLNTDDGDGSIMQGEMIRRIPWVPTDPKVKEIIEASAIPALGGPDQQATRLWWDVEGSNF